MFSPIFNLVLRGSSHVTDGLLGILWNYFLRSVNSYSFGFNYYSLSYILTASIKTLSLKDDVEQRSVICSVSLQIFKNYFTTIL